MRYRRVSGPRMGWAPRCPDCGGYYDFYCPVQYGCRFCRACGGAYMDEYFPRDVEYWLPRYGQRKARHYMGPGREEMDKESRKRILKEELEDIEKEMGEIKEELKELEEA